MTSKKLTYITVSGMLIGVVVIAFIGTKAYTNCVFDWCALWNGIFLGIVASVLSSVFVLGFISWKRRMKFGNIQGRYKGYVFGEDEQGNKTDVLDKTNPTSEAKIEQIGDNILSIEVKELGPKNSKGENYIWSGEMTMELETSQEKFGTIVWRYTNLDEGKERFGFKRCIVTEEGHKVKIYLIGEDGFGKEVLLRE
jgi:hypothetical protein